MGKCNAPKEVTFIGKKSNNKTIINRSKNMYQVNYVIFYLYSFLHTLASKKHSKGPHVLDAIFERAKKLRSYKREEMNFKKNHLI